jgi:hypothetical protein
MRRWRTCFGFGLAVALVVPAALVAQKKDTKKQDEARRMQVQTIVKLADEVEGGAAAPNDLGLVLANVDYLKAASNKEYMPFTVTIDASKVTTPTIALYWRVAKPGTLPPAEADAKKNNKKEPKRDLPYEDISYVPVTPGTTPMRISRSFTVPAGDYELIVVAQEMPAADAQGKKNAPAPMEKASAAKQTVNVPDFWNGELNTSSVILTQRIDPLSTPLTREQQVERPYALGGLEIVPVLGTSFSKKSELSTFMLIYNPKPDGMNKPNVTVEYNFCQLAPGTQPKEGEPCQAGEKFFNKTKPQDLNAQTLPPEFDLSAGHQLQTGQAVPLASFPEGQYRLEIKVTDKNANTSVTKNVNFTVTPA